MIKENNKKIKKRQVQKGDEKEHLTFNYQKE